MGIIQESRRMRDSVRRIGRTINVRIRIKLRRGSRCARADRGASGRPGGSKGGARREGVDTGGRAHGVPTMPGYVRVPTRRRKTERGERERKSAVHARFFYEYHDAAAPLCPLCSPQRRRRGDDDSQCTLQRFYVINTDALAGI